MSISGTADREPLKHGGFQSQYESGINGALSTAFTLLMRDFTNEGQHVDVSIQEVVNSTLVVNQPFYSWTGAVQGRRRSEGAGFGNVMPCADGYFISQPGGVLHGTILLIFMEMKYCEKRSLPTRKKGFKMELNLIKFSPKLPKTEKCMKCLNLPQRTIECFLE